MSKIVSINIEPIGNKQWVKVYFENGMTWVPKIIELAEISHKIGVCEDEKYNFPANNVKGAEMIIDCLRDAILLGSDPETLEFLKNKYQLPG